MNQTDEAKQDLAGAESDFRHVLKTAVNSKNAADGRNTDRRGVIADTLLLRGILTGHSIHLLLNPQAVKGVPKLNSPDFASVAVLTRSIVEAYLTMHNLALKGVSPDEAALRLLWWDWHRVNEEIRARDLIESSHPTLLLREGKRLALEREIRSHHLFHAIPSDLASQFLKGKAPRRPLFEKLPEIATQAGIHPSHFKSQYQMQSDAAHSQSVVVSILEAHDPATPRVRVSLKTSLRCATAHLAFMVAGHAYVHQSKPSQLDWRFCDILTLWQGVYATPFDRHES